MAGTTLIYNGIPLTGCHSAICREEVRYTPGNAQAIFHVYTIRVATVVHRNAFGATMGYVSPTELTTSSQSHPARLTSLIKQSLLVPRQALTYTHANGQCVYADGANDCDLGPTPISCDVTSMTNQTFRIEYEVRCSILRCTSATGGEPPSSPSEAQANFAAAPAVLSHTWGYQERFLDPNLMAEREWTGTLRVKSKDVSPHLYRNMVLPSLSRGYRRVRQDFTTQKDNPLELSYTITDRSADMSPPSPATSGGCRFIWDLQPEGSVGSLIAQSWLIGPPGCDRYALLVRCLQLIQSRTGPFDKVRVVDGDAEFSGFIQDASIVEETSTEMPPKVDATVRLLISRTSNAPDGEDPRFLINLDVYRCGKPVNEFTNAKYDEETGALLESGLTTDDPTNPHYLDRSSVMPAYLGNSPVSAFVVALSTPCGGALAMPNLRDEQAISDPDRQDPEDDDQPPETTFTTVADTAPLAEPSVPVSSAQQAPTFYSHYRISNTYSRGGGRTAVPLTAPLTYSGRTLHTAVVQLTQRQAKRKVEIEAERLRAAPVLPNTDDIVDANGVHHYYLDSTERHETPSLAADGATQVFRSRMTIDYALERDLSPTEQLRIGASPVLTYTPDDNEFLLQDNTDTDIA